mmetsp:Transcript_14833/g.42784  ORF Transcript_14833/g.42784 Transcript_14833/m.42784 type:complete len:307 (+) Transcript_14833:339-1259(+)
MRFGEVESLTILQILLHLHQLLLVGVNILDQSCVGSVQALCVLVQLVEGVAGGGIGLHQSSVVLLQRLVVSLHALALCSELHILFSQVLDNLSTLINQCLLLSRLVLLLGFGTKLIFKLLLVFFHLLFELELGIFQIALALFFGLGQLVFHLVQLIGHILFFLLPYQRLSVLGTLNEATHNCLDTNGGLLGLFAHALHSLLVLRCSRSLLLGNDQTEETLDWNDSFRKLGILFAQDSSTHNETTSRSLDLDGPLVPNLGALRLQELQAPGTEVGSGLTHGKTRLDISSLVCGFQVFELLLTNVFTL